MGVISINSDKKDAVICVDKLYRDAVAAQTVKATAPAKQKKSKKPDKTSSEASGKRTSSKCCEPIEESPENSTGKISKASPPATKKVPAREEGTGGTFTISAALDSK